MDDRKDRAAEPLLSEAYESVEMPNLRKENESRAFADLAKCSVRRVKLNSESEDQPKEERRDIMQELRVLTGLEKEPKDSILNKAKKPAPISLLERYKKCSEGTIRREWADKAEKGELGPSGLPAYMSLLIEGKEDEFETEMVKYCKLAGLKYKTTKDKMKAEVETIKKDMTNALNNMLMKLDNIVASYKQLDHE